jgi:hypothetical protein
LPFAVSTGYPDPRHFPIHGSSIRSLFGTIHYPDA